MQVFLFIGYNGYNVIIMCVEDHSGFSLTPFEAGYPLDLAKLKGVGGDTWDQTHEPTHGSVAHFTNCAKPSSHFILWYVKKHPRTRAFTFKKYVRGSDIPPFNSDFKIPLEGKTHHSKLEIQKLKDIHLQNLMKHVFFCSNDITVLKLINPVLSLWLS